jgi:formate hydrogenlyase subunit 4
MNLEGIAAQLAAMLLALVGAPLLTGWVNQCRARLQNRTAPPLLQPFRMLHKLFWKDAVIARDATPIYRLSPYVVFGCMLLASMIIPTV